MEKIHQVSIDKSGECVNYQLPECVKKCGFMLGALLSLALFKYFSFS